MHTLPLAPARAKIFAGRDGAPKGAGAENPAAAGLLAEKFGERLGERAAVHVNAAGLQDPNRISPIQKV
jgi:hypothetical protein